jgi:hypothetical protein
VDDEVMVVTKGYVTAATTVPVVRGRMGTAQSAHPASANVVHGDAADFDAVPAQATTPFPYQQITRKVSYSAAGAITLPNAGETVIAVLNGTDALAMTLAVPPDDIDGAQLFIVGNGKAAHTVTAASGFGLAGTSYDVATFNANGNCGVHVIAVNGAWVLLSSMTGTLTNFVPAIA